MCTIALVRLLLLFFSLIFFSFCGCCRCCFSSAQFMCVVFVPKFDVQTNQLISTGMIFLWANKFFISMSKSFRKIANVCTDSIITCNYVNFFLTRMLQTTFAFHVMMNLFVAFSLPSRCMHFWNEVAVSETQCLHFVSCFLNVQIS